MITIFLSLTQATISIKETLSKLPPTRTYREKFSLSHRGCNYPELHSIGLLHSLSAKWENMDSSFPQSATG